MRVVFLGTPELAVPTLATTAADHEVVAVVCQPDKPQGRSKTPVPPPVKDWALAAGIEVHQPTKLNDGTFEAWLRERRPDVGVVAAYGRLLKAPILEVPPHGWINMHPSLLPRWRGPSPIQSSLLAGDGETGVSIMRLVLETDAGDVLLQESTPVPEDETILELAPRLGEMGGRLIVDALRLIADGKAVYVPQDASQVVYARMLAKEDGAIDWSQPAREIHNRVRALASWPVAYARLRETACRVHRTTFDEHPAEAAPGTILETPRDSIWVASGSGRIGIQVLQLAGKKRLDAGVFLRGVSLGPGDRFENG